MSRLQVQRQITDNATYILGEMTLNGKHLCYTLEPAYEREPHPAIPAGTYPLTLQPSGEVYTWMCSTLTSHETDGEDINTVANFVHDGIPLLENVPGRSGIEIHIGNFPKDTLGCTLTGSAQGKGTVTGSTVAYYKIYPILREYIQNEPGHTIDYIDMNNLLHD